jgi:hypothetical protein
MLAADGGGIVRGVIIHQPVANPSRLGAWGRRPADRLATGLAAWLDDHHHLVRRPRVEGEWLAGVVVGPGGSWTLADLIEVGRFRKRNGHWYRWNSGTESWVPWEAAAVTAARLAGHRLERALDRAGLPSEVEPVLAIAPRSEVTWDADQEPGVHVQSQASPEDLANRMSDRQRLKEIDVARIVALLDPRVPLPGREPT